MKHNSLILMLAAAMGIVAMLAKADVYCTGASATVRVDQTSGTRIAQATETIVYSPKWAGVAGDPTVSVYIQDDATLVNGAKEAGTYAWTPNKPGTYCLKHETRVGSSLEDALTANFEVLAEVTVADVTGATYEAYTNEVPVAVPFMVSATTPIKVVYTISDEGKMFPGGYKTFTTNLTANVKEEVVALTADQQPIAAAACTDCITFSADAAFGIKMTKLGSPTIVPALEYSTDGTYWSAFDWATGANAGADNKLYFRGTGNQRFAEDYKRYYAFTNTASSAATAIACSGNIMTLLDYETVANGGESTMGDSAFTLLFGGLAALTTAPELPATNLATRCYQQMFQGCTALTTAPKLPATKLADYCYANMFQDCTSLTEAPELPATNLAKYCYYQMFYGCTALTTAPKLPVTELVDYCYANMFQDCTSLTGVPELPATKLADNCCFSMFQGCTALTDVPELAATNLASYCYVNMFKGCTSLEVNTNAPGKAWSIPSEAATSAASANLWNYDMFKGTAGSITNAPTSGKPDVGVTYYIASALVMVVVETNGLGIAGTTVQVQDAAGEPLAEQTKGEFAGKLAVQSNSIVKVVWTANPGVYFLDGSTTHTQTFTADKSVNVASAAVTMPAAPAKPSVKLGVVAQRYPWDGNIDVNYWAKNMPNDRYMLKVTVKLPNGTERSQMVPAQSGKNAMVFDAKAKFSDVKFTEIINVKVSAKLVQPN